MKKFFIPILLFTILFSQINAQTIKADQFLPKTAYTIDGKIKIYSSWYGRDNQVLTAEIGKIDLNYLKQTFYGADDSIITGKISYPNYDKMTVGEFDLQWTFVPDDNKYETKNGIFHFTIFPEDTEKSKGRLDTEEVYVDTTIAPSLTATSIILSPSANYDINVNNKVQNSTYQWKSSNTKVASVNKSGVVTPLNEGKALITCDITLPDSTVTTLSSDVTVGLDEDNSPTISDQDLVLEVGDVFDLDVDNTVKGSKVKWTSSDKSIVKVSSVSGKLTTLKQGKVTITCTITNTDKSVIVLNTSVEVE